MKKTFHIIDLGGETSNIFDFQPNPWVSWSNLTFIIFFKWIGKGCAIEAILPLFKHLGLEFFEMFRRWSMFLDHLDTVEEIRLTTCYLWNRIEKWDIVDINWCRIPSINNIDLTESTIQKKT